MKFLKKMYQKSKEQKGFTLVEMIVVLVIIAILAAITIPALLKYIDKAKEKQVVIDARTAYLAAETAASEAYAADTDVPTSKKLEFTQTASTTDAVSANATNLTGITKEYTCTVTLGTDWEITKVEFTESGKKATLDLSAAATDKSWVVTAVTTKSGS